MILIVVIVSETDKIADYLKRVYLTIIILGEEGLFLIFMIFSQNDFHEVK